MGASAAPPRSPRCGAGSVRTASTTSPIAIWPRSARSNGSSRADAAVVSPPRPNRSRLRPGSTPAGSRTIPNWSNGSPGDIASGASGPRRCGGPRPHRGRRGPGRGGDPGARGAPRSRRAPRDGSWLVKPIASGGGRGIEPLTGPDRSPTRPVVLLSAARRRPEFLGPVHRAGRPGSAGRGHAAVDPASRAVRSPTAGASAPGRSPRPWPRGSGAGRPAGVRLRPRRLVRRGLRPSRRHPLAGRDQPPLYGLARDPRAGLGPILLLEHRRACEGPTGPAPDSAAIGSSAIPVVGQVDPLRPATTGRSGEHVGRPRLPAIPASPPTIADVPAPGTCIEPGSP